ncbi:MAG: TonB-dependent receptor [Acidobacteriota bacterium]
MRILTSVAFSILLAVSAFGQGANGTITGTVVDPSGAVISGATIHITNTANGRVITVQSTETGNYTAQQLPVGAYDLSVTHAGFKAYNRVGLDLAAAQIMRIDIPLAIGAVGDTVTVTAEASLLKTESGDVTRNVTVGQLNTLPVLSIGGGGGTNTNGFRDPLGVALMIPGVQYAANSSMVVNGVPNGNIQIRIEGQVSGQTGSLRNFTGMGQASVEAVQEVAVQTSNFSAEFGAVGGGIFNVTMKSGTNQFHGSAYDYVVNEALNSHIPYTGLRSPAKRHNFGATFGGPVKLGPLYDGTNKTFFFGNYEQFREDIGVNLAAASLPTVPIQAYRDGNFAQVIIGSGNAAGPLPLQVSAGRNYIDPLGRSGFNSGTIFDPGSQQTVRCVTTGAVGQPNCANGSDIQVRNAFVNNVVPISLFDPVSVKILKLVPQPLGPNAASGQIGRNYQNPFLSSRRSHIPSVKLDHSLGANHRISFFYQKTQTGVQYTTPNGAAEGLPEPVTVAIGSYAITHTYRLTWDYTVKPNMLLHVGAGWFLNNFDTHAGTTDYDAVKELGLRGATVNRTFPQIQTSLVAASTGIGGMSNLGPGNQSTAGAERRPSGVANLSLVKGNHSYKIGGEWRGERYPARSFTNTSGTYSFGANSTQQTALQAVTLSQGTTGFGFASFLMGNVTGYSLSLPTAISIGKMQWALFAQDTWKITRKLTLDYGLRWDLGTYARERWGRNSNFSSAVANASAGGHPGAQIFEATCNCNFATNYPYAVGPRVGVAYQFNSKTVLRGGIGVVYNSTGTVGGNTTNTATGGTPVNGAWLGLLKDGIPSSVQPRWPVYDANVGQSAGTVVGAPTFLDPNAGRPARQYQWSLGLQREITRNLVVEASYVANRGVWWPAATLAPINSLSEQSLARYGFKVGDVNDATLLNRQISSLTTTQASTLAARGVVLPYSGFPTAQLVRQSLYPFPQYTGGATLTPTLAPLGKTWYDSLQVVVTQRFSHGLTVNGSYTFSKALDLMGATDVFNRANGKDLSGTDLPHQMRLTAEYLLPNLRNSGLGLLSSPVGSYLIKDWSIGWYMQYQSAGILGRPSSNSTNPINFWLGRGPGSAQLKTVNGEYMSPFATNWTDYDGKVHAEPIDINCHCFDPTKTLVLNTSAWENIPDGKWAAQTTGVRNYRGIRQPQENANLNRSFRMGKEGRFVLNVRAEFTNVFNRTRLPNPTAGGNFTAAPTTQTGGSNNGLYNGGFGTIVPISGTTNVRSGTLIGRLTF